MSANPDISKQIRIRRLQPSAKLPTRREGDIGWDLYAVSVETVSPGIFKVSTGISLELPRGYWGQIENRSSMGKGGYDVHGGIIDNIYRGEIILIFAAHSPNAPLIESGAKVAQLIIRKQEDDGWQLTEVDTLSETIRGDNGFGSTGR